MALFHYTDVVQTDRGAGLEKWRVQIVTAGTSTVQPIYSDINGTPILAVSGLTNFAVSDHAGNYDFFCLEGVYDLMIYNDAGVFQRRITYKSMYGAALALGSLPYVTVEQFGAVGLTARNDQAAFQAAVNYAQTNGIPEIKLGAKTYEIWQAIRTTDPVYTYQVADGISIYITGNIKITGVAGKTKLRFLNSAGGTNDTITQNPAATPWRGYGIVVNPAATIDYFILEDIILDGTKPYYFPGAPTNAQSDITHKAISTNPVTGDILYKRFKNVKAINWGGEIVYDGGGATSKGLSYDCEWAYSNQSGWNPTGLGTWTNYDINAHDCYLASEEISGAGRRYIKGRFANCYNCGSIGTQYYTGGQSYTVPNRDLTVAPKFVDYTDTLLENVSQVSIGSWSRGRIKSIDSGFVCGATGRDIFIDIDAVTDQGTATVILTLSGPPNLTTYYSGYSSGPYQTALANSHFKIRNRLTARAKANSVTVNAVQIQGGLIDQATVRVDVEGEFTNVYSVIGTPVTGQVQPKINFGDIIPLAAPYGGTTDNPSGDYAYAVAWAGVCVSPPVAGMNLTFAATFGGNPYAMADGQEVFVEHNGAAGRVIRIPANGAMLGLSQDRYLTNPGDIERMIWDKVAGVLREKSYSSSRVLKTAPTVVNAATYAVVDTDTVLRITTTNCTVTLPAPAFYPGRTLAVSTLTANSLTSASSNVCPLGSATPGTAILAATAAKFANLRSDGAVWNIEGAN